MVYKGRFDTVLRSMSMHTNVQKGTRCVFNIRVNAPSCTHVGIMYLSVSAYLFNFYSRIEQEVRAEFRDQPVQQTSLL